MAEVVRVRGSLLNTILLVEFYSTSDYTYKRLYSSGISLSEVVRIFKIIFDIGVNVFREGAGDLYTNVLIISR